MSYRKISSPSAGLLARNLGDSGAGAHPVLRLVRLAGFSHPRNPKISRVLSALIAPGKEIFQAESPSRRRRWAVAEKFGINFSAGPPSEADSLTVFNPNLQMSNQDFYRPFSPALKKPRVHFLITDATVGRASAGG